MYSLDRHKNETESNGEMNFYGKIINTNSNPIEGVLIEVELSSYKKYILQKIGSGVNSDKERLELKSDKDGCFSVANKHGFRLTLIDFSKNGYQINGKKRSWSFSFLANSRDRYRPNQQNPKIFVMEEIK